MLDPLAHASDDTATSNGRTHFSARALGGAARHVLERARLPLFMSY